jgi:hypothetical protein
MFYSAVTAREKPWRRHGAGRQSRSDHTSGSGVSRTTIIRSILSILTEKGVGPKLLVL